MKEYIIVIGDEPDIMGNYGLKEKPTELIRCKDCKHGEPGACGDGVDCDGVWHEADWFCADGERK